MFNPFKSKSFSTIMGCRIVRMGLISKSTRPIALVPPMPTHCKQLVIPNTPPKIAPPTGPSATAPFFACQKTSYPYKITSCCRSTPVDTAQYRPNGQNYYIEFPLCFQIAAYKAAALASALVKLNANVEVVMTQNATKFIAPLTFEQLTGNRTIVDTFDRNYVHQVEHISLAERTDHVIIAPATANVCAKIALGLADDKIKKQDNDLCIPVRRTTDILAWLGSNRREGQVICGFSMETQDLIENSRAKLYKKNVDMICANNLKQAGAGFGVDTNIITFITKEDMQEHPLQQKTQIAHTILDKMMTL